VSTISRDPTELLSEAQLARCFERTLSTTLIELVVGSRQVENAETILRTSKGVSVVAAPEVENAGLKGKTTVSLASEGLRWAQWSELNVQIFADAAVVTPEAPFHGRRLQKIEELHV